MKLEKCPYCKQLPVRDVRNGYLVGYEHDCKVLGAQFVTKKARAGDEDVEAKIETAWNEFVKALRGYPRTKLKLIPKSLVGKCVGHHPERRIYREIPVYNDDKDPCKETGKNLVRAHPATSIQDDDKWCK